MHRGLEVEVGQPAVGLLRNSATNHKGFRREELLVLAQHHGEALGILTVGPVVLGLDRSGRQVLGFLPVNHHVADLGIREKLAVKEESRANARTQSEENHRTLGGARISELCLRQAGGVGVVKHRYIAATKGLAEELAYLGADPGGIDVCSRQCGLVLDNGGDSDAYRAVPAGFIDDLGDHFGDGLGGCGLRCGDAALGVEHHPLAHVDQRTLDGRTTDINAETLLLCARKIHITHDTKIFLMHNRAMDNVESLRKIAAEIAVAAASLVAEKRAELSGDGALARSVETKTSAVDPVTVVDKASEEFIVGKLAELRPNDGVLGEEGSSQEGSSGITWVVDPIDGTVNFLYGVPAYAISIAAALGEKVVAGAVINVESKELYLAARGQGSYRYRLESLEHFDYGELDHGVKLHTSAANDVATSLVATGFSYQPEKRERQAHILLGLLPRVRDIRRIGSAALDLCRVAEGSVDIYYEHGTHPWDFAAGSLIAAEAGAVLRRPSVLDEAKPWELILACAPSVEKQWDDVAAMVGLPQSIA